MADEQAFLCSFRQEERRLAAYLLSVTGDFHAVEDLLQGVARVLWEKLGEYDETRPFGAWAMGVARLEALKWRHQAKRRREVLSEEAMQLLAETTSGDSREIDQRYLLLADCFKALSATARRVLQLKYAQGKKIAEIAGHTDKTAAAVEMILVRSRRQLRRCVQRKMSRIASEAL